MVLYVGVLGRLFMTTFQTANEAVHQGVHATVLGQHSAVKLTNPY